MIKILRTAAGASVAPSLIKNLKEFPDVQVVAADISASAAGFQFADSSHIVSRADNPDYVNELVEICAKEKIDIFIPDLDEELKLVAAQKGKFEEVGTTVILSDLDALKIATSKQKTFDFFHRHNFPAPFSTMDKEIALKKLEFPFILKPEYGRGSQGIFLLKNEKDLDLNLEENGKAVFQEYLPGREFTIDTLSDMQGNFRYCSIRERTETDSGISTKGVTLFDEKLEKIVGQICDALQLKGPGCLQCKSTEDGLMKFIEINPRIAGTAILSIRAGAPILHDLLRLHLGEEIIGKKDYKVGYKMARYWSEVYFEADD